MRICTWHAEQRTRFIQFQQKQLIVKNKKIFAAFDFRNKCSMYK